MEEQIGEAQEETAKKMEKQKAEADCHIPEQKEVMMSKLKAHHPMQCHDTQ